MTLEEFIDKLNEMIGENGSDWTQFEVQCLSTDGTTVYLQCS